MRKDPGSLLAARAVALERIPVRKAIFERRFWRTFRTPITSTQIEKSTTMRIGHAAQQMWSEGGIATYIRRLGRAQERSGNSVSYLSHGADAGAPVAGGYAMADSAALFQKARALQLDVLHLHGPVDALPEGRPPTVRTMHGNQGSCPSGTRYLRRPGQPCDRAYSVPGCLWGHFVDGCGSRRPQNVRAHFRRIRREQQLAAQLPTFTVSQFLKDQMIRSGCPGENLHVLPSPAPRVEKPFEPPPTTASPRFLFLGRIAPQKGVDWLLRATARVSADLHLDIAGTGEERVVAQMQRLAAKLGLEECVTFHGWVEDPKPLLHAARAVVFPSVWHEPAGLVTLEAAAHGRPVIASRVGGIPEYASEKHALLVDPHDEGGLAHAIGRLARDPRLAERMGRAGRQRVRARFSMGDFVADLDKQYRGGIRSAAVAKW